MTKRDKTEKLVQALLPDLRDRRQTAWDTVTRDAWELIEDICLHVTQNRDKADELVSEVWARIYRHFSQFREESLFFTWVYRIAQNAQTDLNRRSHKHTHPDLAETNFRADSGDPYEIITTRMEHQRLLSALSRLPQSLREVALRTLVHDQQEAEVAREMQISIPTVKSRLHRARTQLRRLGRECAL